MAAVHGTAFTDEQINAIVEGVRRRLLEAREFHRETLVRNNAGVHRYAEHGDAFTRIRPNGSLTIEILIAGGAHDTGLGIGQEPAPILEGGCTCDVEHALFNETCPLHGALAKRFGVAERYPDENHTRPPA